ncbi:zinc ribbon domain-containing protein [Chloroflexota bacterium]
MATIKLKEVNANRAQSQIYETTMPSSIERNKTYSNAICTALIVVIILALLLPGIALAQSADYPVPLRPKPNETDVPVTSIFFSWEPFYVGTEEYTLEISQNADMSDPFEAIIRGGTTYMYVGTLQYNNTYYWRVMATEPLGGEWGSSIFTTQAPPTTSTDNTTTSPDSTEESFLSYLENIGWPIVGTIAGIILIAIVALVILIKPKSPTTSRQWQGTQPPHMQQPLVCPVCGSPNNPGRQFCSNCGHNLIGLSPQQARGTPPLQQQINTCSTCGFPHNPPERKFCGNCGANLIASNPQPQPSWGTQQAKYCPACGTANPKNQNFCSNCRANLASGTPQQQYQVYQTYSCPTCGAPINKGLNPCPNCRTWLDWGAY